MTPAIELTSVPPWALRPTTEPRDPVATSLSVFAVGTAAAEVARTWTDGAVAPVRVHLADDLAEALAAFDTDVAGACVGWRALLAGDLVDVLRLRAHALEHGLADDEIAVATTRTDELAVACVHCASVVVTRAAVGDVVACEGCGRSLLVYHHVSRRKAAFLGFQVDAETWEA